MVILVVHHKVKDYDTWKKAFDAHEPVRKKYGEIEHRIYQNIKDPNLVVVHNDFPSEQDAQNFMADPSLKEVMQQAGVEGEPGFNWITLSETKKY